MNFGTLQRRWQAERPVVYDKLTRTVNLDIQAEARAQSEVATADGAEAQLEEPSMVEGYSCLPVQIDSLIEYSHIKSQLIEAAFPPKDEFAKVINAAEALAEAILAEDSFKSVQSKLKANADVSAFLDFCAYRKMCADAAKEVMKAY